jgi:hypothetical protein
MMKMEIKEMTDRIKETKMVLMEKTKEEEEEVE